MYLEKALSETHLILNFSLQHEQSLIRLLTILLARQVEKLEEGLRASRKREEELRARLGNATERGMAELLKRMESEHRSLLRHQLDLLQQVVMASRSPTSVLQLTDQHGQEIQVSQNSEQALQP